MQIIFLPENKKVTVTPKVTVLEAAAKASVFIDAVCAGRGTCGKCKVRILSGETSEISEEEMKSLTKKEITAGIRLACKVYGKEDLTVELLDKDYKSRKNVRKSTTSILPREFKHSKIEEMDGKVYGIAFDIGTTSVVGILWNLKSGEELETIARANPQRAYGADVISRIQYSIKEEQNLRELQEKIVQCLEDIMSQLLNNQNINNNEIYSIVVVGNTTMSHLFLGKSVEGLSKAPFTPAFQGMVRMEASDLFRSLDKNTKLFVLPNIGGHVGSDITAGILAKSIDLDHKGVTAFIDIGTNGEIVVKDNNKMYACSTAAGPAFEGASIHAGMRADIGAIEGVVIQNGKITLDVIGDTVPQGICGSGLIDAIAELLDAGIIDETGRILDKESLREEGIHEELIERIVETERGNDFILYFAEQKEENILLTQKDIREVQLAKAAIYAGVITMLSKVQKKVEDVETLMVAGAFGNYIKKESAIRMGLLPNINPNKIIMVGNTASLGASMVLLSKEYEKRVEYIRDKILHMDLADDPDFIDIYIEAMNFPNLE